MFNTDIDYELFLQNRIADLRAKRSVSARDMSLSIGQSENYINVIENKRALPSMSVFFYICNYFGISPKEFFDEENNNPILMQDIINELKTLNDEQLSSIYTLIKNFSNKQ